MEVVRDITEDEMVLAFVRAERESPHHRWAYLQIAVQVAGGNVSL